MRVNGRCKCIDHKAFLNMKHIAQQTYIPNQLLVILYTLSQLCFFSRTAEYLGRQDMLMVISFYTDTQLTSTAWDHLYAQHYMHIIAEWHGNMFNLRKLPVASIECMRQSKYLLVVPTSSSSADVQQASACSIWRIHGEQEQLPRETSFMQLSGELSTEHCQIIMLSLPFPRESGNWNAH